MNSYNPSHPSYLSDDNLIAVNEELAAHGLRSRVRVAHLFTSTELVLYPQLELAAGEDYWSAAVCIERQGYRVAPYGAPYWKVSKP